MKKIYLILFSILCFFTVGTVKASTIESIDTTVFIDENGNGKVTEIWRANIDEGTELYHSFGNMENREITNFTVSRDGIEYTNLTNWNPNWEKSNKNNKNGINYTNDGLELCWGIEYGPHTYTIHYTIKNLVWQYKDNQIMYFAFLPKDMKPAPKSFNLIVKGNKQFSDIKYSSYGFDSNNSITNGQINFRSNKALKSSEYVVALVGFPNGTFAPAITKYETYNDVVNEALRGAKLNENTETTIIDITMILIMILGSGVVGFCIIMVVITISGLTNQDRYDETEFVIPNEINNFRDIPFDKDPMEAYFIGERKNVMRKDNLIGTILLKWIKQNKIEMVQTEGSVLDFNKDDNYYIDLSKLQNCETKTEEDLKGFLMSVADNNNHLTPKKFKKWCKKNYKKIDNWIEEAMNFSKEILVSKGYIEKVTENYTKNKTKKVYKLTPKLADEFIKLKGLKKFLNDMTIIEEKKAIEVHIWDEYLIFAESFGIAEKVAKQFKDFHPVEYNENINYYNNYMLIHNFNMESMSAVSAAKIAARSAASSGGSFSGGGMSSGGFSSGGGVR